MRRKYPCLTLGAFALPGAAEGGSLGSARKMHFAGLGDGNIHHSQQQQGLRGATKRKRMGRRRGADEDDRLPSTFARADLKDYPPRYDSRRATSAIDGADNKLDDMELMDYLRKGGARPTVVRREDVLAQARGDYPANNPPLASDGPWQLSVLVLLGIVGVLVGLFVHFSTDPAAGAGGQAPYFRRRIQKKKPNFHSNPSYKNKKTDDKKPDYWSDEEGNATEDDKDYRGDAEGGAAVGDRGSIAKKRSTMPKVPDDPTARLYYQLKPSDSFRQREHRLRKSATQQSSNSMGMSRPESTVPTSTFHSPSRPSFSSSALSGNKTSSSPFPPSRSSSTHSGSRSPFTPSRSSTHSGNIGLKFDKANPPAFPMPPLPIDNSGVGSGLEGFEHHVGSFSGDDASAERSNPPAFKASPLVKPMGTFTPTESFASMAPAPGERLVAALASEGTSSDVDFSTPPISLEEESTSSSLSASSLRSSPRQSEEGSSPYSEMLSELPTPRVDHTRGKRDLARVLKEKGSQISNIPLSFTSAEDGSDSSAALGESSGVPRTETDSASCDLANADSASCDLADAFPGLPLVPNLNTGDANSFHLDAPRSLALEELQLVRMESGVSGPRWRTKHELEQLSTESMEKRRQQSENEEKLREASAAVDPADDPRNSIQHIRKDLTISSDASSSLSSKITFSELKLEDVIGGGGFGQVWRARWKGTPVAVKVLTGSAQAETVPKAVLEEFIAEINMVSGMRHPNICLFMGACLDPPNRAIVTELCENGSLWDALRSPLSAYEAADGRTRLAWPLEIYEPMTPTPPTFQERHLSLSSFEPPLAPGGAWPWILVKRVVAGTARGMCYLHSGNPPVLHRDLKSANILLDESYTAKLADFGLSRLKAVRSGMTGNCGTVQWMAPEVLCNENYAEPADVFSFGIILWEMLTKECPYDGMTPIQCALSVLNENKRPKIPEWCPQSLRALIKNCVERDPHSRPTFAQILAALDALP